MKSVTDFIPISSKKEEVQLELRLLRFVFRFFLTQQLRFVAISLAEKGKKIPNHLLEKIANLFIARIVQVT